MEVGTTRGPGQKGTKRLQARFGDRLLYVRYRYDRDAGRRFTTVEIIIDSQPWVPRAVLLDAPPASVARAGQALPSPPCAPEREANGPAHLPIEPRATVGLRIGYHESELRAQVKAAGGKWDRERGGWIIAERRARALRLQDRIVEDRTPAEYAGAARDLKPETGSHRRQLVPRRSYTLTVTSSVTRKVLRIVRRNGGSGGRRVMHEGTLPERREPSTDNGNGQVGSTSSLTVSIKVRHYAHFFVLCVRNDGC
jgi:hypothetical protein